MMNEGSPSLSSAMLVDINVPTYVEPRTIDGGGGMAYSDILEF